MVAHVLPAIARRGYEHVYEQIGRSHIPPGFLIAGPMLILLVIPIYFALGYTYGEVVATLAMVEAPTATAIIESPPAYTEEPDAPLLSKDEKEAVRLVEQEALLVPHKPITSSLFATTRHLQSKAGWTARFRGLQLYLIQGALENLVISILPFTKSVFGLFIAYGLVRMVTVRFSMAWVHLVISEPGTSWTSRLRLPRSSIKKALIPTLFVSMLQTSLLFGFVGIFMGAYTPRFLLPGIRLSGNQEVIGTMIMTLCATVVLLLATFRLVLPFSIALTRLYASLLPVEEQTIVPVDLTFGGKLMTESVKGCGMASLWQARLSIDRKAFFRVYKVWFLTGAMQFAFLVTAVGSSIALLTLVL